MFICSEKYSKLFQRTQRNNSIGWYCIELGWIGLNAWKISSFQWVDFFSQFFLTKEFCGKQNLELSLKKISQKNFFIIFLGINETWNNNKKREYFLSFSLEENCWRKTILFLVLQVLRKKSYYSLNGSNKEIFLCKKK